MIIRRTLGVVVSEYLKKEYVALLGQSESGLQSFIDMLVEESPVSGMQFISIFFPSGIKGEDDLIDIFLQRLIWAINDVQPEKTLKKEIEQVAEKYAQITAGFRLRKVLDHLGYLTSANPLVIALPSLTDVPDEPLKNLLDMLRDYNQQRTAPRTPGQRLRFLIAGDQRLWMLCCKGLQNHESPFGIAKPVFLDGLSYQEIEAFNQSQNLEASLQIQTLTAGIPSLIEKISELPGIPDDLSPFFEQLERSWSALPESSRQALKRLAEGSEHFPLCIPGYQCPQIPRVETPWIEAFWEGFLSVRHGELTWRSPIHRAFVMDRMRVQGDRSRSELVKIDLLDRALRLGRVLKQTQEDENRQKYLEEALLLAVQSQNALLTSVLKMLWHEEAMPAILEELHQIAASSKKGWMKELDEKIAEDRNVLTHLLIDAAVWESRRLMGAFDVFLCYNEEDKVGVKIIAEKLLERDILPWLDMWEIRPGESWLQILEKHIDHIKVAAVFVGNNGISSLQLETVNTLFSKTLQQDSKIIPVILPDVPQESEIAQQAKWPLFLNNRRWVDFRQSDPHPIEQLIWGIRGQRRTPQS